MAPSKSKSLGPDKKDSSKKSKKETKKSPPTQVYKSEEFVQDSDEEVNAEDEPADEDSSEVLDRDKSTSSAKPTKATSKANGKLPAPAGSSSSSEGESEEGEESSEEGDESSEEEDSDDSTQEAPVAIEPMEKPAKQPTTNTVSSQAPPPYRPPPGFDLASLDGRPKASQMLEKTSLKGKQLWYFTAPASVPISSIKAMSLLDAKNGKTVLTHDGTDYGFMKDSAEDTTYTRIMVPSSDAGYKATSKLFDEVFHLQQVAQDPTTANPARATIPSRKPVRQQPRGLKMRFHPIGFGATQPGIIGSSSSDEEMVDSPALPSKPHFDVVPSSSDIVSKNEKKRKHGEGGEKKRKHGEGGEKKSKHRSSSKLSDINRRELKRLKVESQRDNLSVSTEHQENTEPPLPLPSKTPPKHLVSTTPIPPPKPATLSQPSATNTGVPNSKSSSKKSKSTEEYRGSSVTPSSNGPLSLQELAQATDPRLSGEERRKKMKKLKHKDAKRQKGNLG